MVESLGFKKSHKTFIYTYSVHLGEFLLQKELEEPKVEPGENYLSQHKKN
jgi:hypothetical protein